jgi:Leucine-rich repeat (LRR) protein
MPTISSLDVSNTDLNSLPDGLTVTGNVDLTGTKITKIPKNFKVGGTFIDANGKTLQK